MCLYAIRKPLQPPYDGPYKVLQRTEKYFVVEVKGKQDSISLDRLKPAHLDKDDNTDSIPTSPVTIDPFSASHSNTDPWPTTRVTRSGRQVHYPVRFSK